MTAAGLSTRSSGNSGPGDLPARGGVFLQTGLGPLVLIIGALITFAVWKRVRFFGTAAPLIAAAVLMIAALGTRAFFWVLFLFVALPFLILFVSGVAVDLLESKYAVLPTP